MFQNVKKSNRILKIGSNKKLLANKKQRGSSLMSFYYLPPIESSIISNQERRDIAEPSPFGALWSEFAASLNLPIRVR